jgi:hypothetical protein
MDRDDFNEVSALLPQVHFMTRERESFPASGVLLPQLRHPG